MTNKLKKLIYVGVVLIMCVGILCACNDDDFRNPRNGEPEAGMLYFDLEMIYNNGWICKGELRQIAHYINSVDNCLDEFSEENKNKILNAVVERDSQHMLPEEQIDINEYRITRYYGTYDGLVFFNTNSPYASDPTVVISYEDYIEIDGVKFHYTMGRVDVMIYRI